LHLPIIGTGEPVSERSTFGPVPSGTPRDEIPRPRCREFEPFPRRFRRWNGLHPSVQAGRL